MSRTIETVFIECSPAFLKFLFSLCLDGRLHSKVSRPMLNNCKILIHWSPRLVTFWPKSTSSAPRGCELRCGGALPAAPVRCLIGIRSLYRRSDSQRSERLTFLRPLCPASSGYDEYRCRRHPGGLIFNSSHLLLQSSWDYLLPRIPLSALTWNPRHSQRLRVTCSSRKHASSGKWRGRRRFFTSRGFLNRSARPRWGWSARVTSTWNDWRHGTPPAQSIPIPDGLVHHWIGAVFIPGVHLGQVLDLVQDYNHHQNIYQPEVVRSRLLEHDGNDYKIYYRLRKKNIITVTLQHQP